MFPFLAPIHQPNYVSQQGTKHFVEITFLADSPYASRAPSTVQSSGLPPKIPSLRNLDDVETASSKSRSSEGINKLGGSRPNSRMAVKKTSVSSLPTSARSEGKSSPVPVKDVVLPAPTRHKNKGLEMSSGMMDIFGGNTNGSGNNPGSVYKNVEDHDVAHDRAVRRARGDPNLSQPGPEWFEGFDKMDLTGIELPPDPNCPAEKYLARGEGGEGQEEKSTPDFDSDWQDAKEDVLEASTFSNLKFSKSFAESAPGPDIGYEEEEDVVEEVQEKVEEELTIVQDAEKEKDGSENNAKKGHPNERRNSEENGETRDSRRDTERNGETPDEQTVSLGGGGSGGAQSDTNASTKSAGGGGMDTLLVKNAQIVNDDGVFVADVLVENGVISNVAPSIEAPEGVEVIDAAGKMLLPAGIDVYTQASESTVDDLATGCRSAIAGGTATIIEVVRARGAESILSAVKRVKSQLEKGGSAANVSLSAAISEITEAVKSDMTALVNSEGVNSFVLDGVRQSDDKLFELLEHASKLGAHVRILPENKSIISILEKKMLKLGVSGPEGYPQSHPEQLEADQVNGICVLSNLANCPVSIVSVSSGESLGAIEKARCSGALAHAEIASAGIATDGVGYSSQDIRAASALLTDVPLRKGAQDRLISALSTQPLVVCTSGHKPVNSTAQSSAKDFTIAPKGTSGAEERMAVVWEKAVRTGRIDPMRFVAVTSSNAAKVFNLYPKKGRIAVGADADLVIWDASGKRILEAKSSQSGQESSLFDGMAVHSSIFATIVAGKIAYQNGEIQEASSASGAGGFLPLTPNSPYLFSMVGMRDKFANVEKIDRNPTAPAAHQNGHSATPPPAKSGEFNRNRKNVMESSIDFGGSAANRGRNPPGGKTTGFW